MPLLLLPVLLLSFPQDICAQQQSEAVNDAKTQDQTDAAKTQKSEDAKESEAKASIDSGSPFADREKSASRPYTYLVFGYMSVPEGKDEEYLAIESEWREIHNLRCQAGQQSFWGLMKLNSSANSKYQYVTIQGYNSLDDSVRPINWWRLQQLKGEEIDHEDLMERTKKARELLYSETYQTIGHQGFTDGTADRLNIGHFRSADGRESEYVDAEIEIAGPTFQKAIDADPAFHMWALNRLVSTTKKSRNHNYQIIHVIDTSKQPKTDEERKSIQDKRRAIFSDDTNNTDWDSLRTHVGGGRMTLILKSSGEANPENAEWQKLQGTWKHVREDGSYRIKKISMGLEVLEGYEADGSLKFKYEVPMRIEVRQGINHFYVYHPKGTYHSVYKVHDGKWYEQGRGIFRNTKSAPDKFLIYEKQN